MKIIFKKLHKDAVIPEYKSEFASGFDFHSIERVHIFPQGTALVKTGLSCEIVSQYEFINTLADGGVVIPELQVRPRSGLSLKTGLRIANAPGTIDYDYRGEIGIIMCNVGRDTVIIHPGDRIAQGVISPAFQVPIEESIEDLSETERGDGGFGSTGAGSEDHGSFAAIDAKGHPGCR